MKSLVFFVLAICFVTAQDVEIPNDLLEETTAAHNQNHSENNFEKELIEETTKESPPDSIREPNRQKIPCDVVPPFEYLPDYQSCSGPCPVQPPLSNPLQPIEVDPIVNEWFNSMEREVHRVCPIGTSLNGSVCVDWNSYDCPQGYHWTNNRCVLSRTSCPIHFGWDGRSCVQRQICPKTHYLENGRCVQPAPECPYYSKWNGNICEFNEIQCPPDSVRRGNECVIERYTCPYGFIEINNICTKEYKQPTCPPRYNYTEGFCTFVRKWCERGSSLYNGQCRSVSISCPPGAYKYGERCFINPPEQTTKSTPTTTSRPKGYYCPEGYTLYNHLCYRCPPNRKLCNNKCIYRNNPCIQPSVPCNPFHPTAPCNPTQPNININVHTNSRGSSQPSSNEGYNIINRVAPVNNTIININNVTHPVTLNNVNKNNIYVYSNMQCPDGSIGTVVVKNNETVSGCVDVKTGKRNETSEEREYSNEYDEDEVTESSSNGEKCCEIVTPRQCRKRNENQWACSHRRYKYCGKFCIAERLYLRPRATTYNSHVLTLTPPEHGIPVTPCFGRRCPPIDCTGCINGSWNCSPQCYTYPCNHDECHYLDHEDFCRTVGGQICE